MATLNELQRVHQEFEREYWDAATDEAGYTRHTLEHLAKLIGKIGNIVEPREHGLNPSTEILKSQVIPDLLYFAIGLAQKHNIDLEEAFLDRLDQNAQKITVRRQGILEPPST